MRLASLALLAVAAGCRAQGAAGPGAAPAVVVELKAVPSADETFGSQFARIGAGGTGSIPFANAEGRLLLKAAGKKVRLDSNGDGVVDDKDAPPAAPGEIVTVRFLLGGRSAEYPVRVEAVENQYVALGGCLVLEGAFDGWRIRLIDAELDGTFGRTGEDSIDVAESKPAGAKKEAEEEDGSEPLPLGSVLSVKGRLYEATVSEGGTRLALRPYTAETGRLTFKGGAGVRSWRLQLSHADDLQFAHVRDADPVRLVPGTYRITMSQISLVPKRGKGDARKPKEGGDREEEAVDLSGYWDYAGSEGPVLHVGSGGQTITLGPPFRLDFDASRAAGKAGRYQIEEPRLVGAGVEWYTPETSAPDGQESTLTSHVRAGGREQKLSTLEFG
jgi:hypothetical protein